MARRAAFGCLEVPELAKAIAASSGLTSRDQIARMTQAAPECRKNQHDGEAKLSGPNVKLPAQDLSGLVLHCSFISAQCMSRDES